MDWKNITLQSFWKKSKEKLIFIFCSGLLLFILALPTEEKAAQEAGATADSAYLSDGLVGPSGSTGAADAAVTTTAGNSTYEAMLEQRIRNILEGVDGVGQVDVMVGTVMPQETGYSALDQETYPEVTGVVISADGGGSPLVETEISQAMEALFGIPSHKIKVLKRVKKESEE